MFMTRCNIPGTVAVVVIIVDDSTRRVSLDSLKINGACSSLL